MIINNCFKVLFHSHSCRYSNYSCKNCHHDNHHTNNHNNSPVSLVLAEIEDVKGDIWAIPCEVLRGVKSTFRQRPYIWGYFQSIIAGMRTVILSVPLPFYSLKATTAGPWSSSSQAFNLVSFKQSPHKPMWMYVDGPLKLPLGGKWGSSVPSKQCAITPKKNAGPTFVPLTMSDLILP